MIANMFHFTIVENLTSFPEDSIIHNATES